VQFKYSKSRSMYSFRSSIFDFAPFSLTPKIFLTRPNFHLRALVAACLLIVCTPKEFHCQSTHRVGLGVEAFSSGNTHGTFYRPYLGWEVGRHFLSVGPLIHKESLMTRGVKIGYSRNMSGPEDRGHEFDRLQINLISHFQYSGLLPMSSYVVREQYCTISNPDVPWENIRISTAELGAGFELRMNIGRFVSWRNSSSMAYFYHPKYVRGLSRERCGMSLALSSGLLFIIP
jgi:hypothetical protein